MNARTLIKHLPIVLSIIVFGVYLSTTTPVVYLGDSGEFTAAAFSLGIAHNSGYPLYSLVGKLFCMIPVGNVAFRLNLMSAFFSTLTIFLVYKTIWRFTRNTLCAAAAACFFAFTPLFWSQTVSAEVYPLHLFFAALMIQLLWRWEQTRASRWLLLFVFVTGISFGNHMQTVMLAPPVLYFVISGEKKAIFSLRNFAAISLCFLLPLTLYLYLPIRTQAGAPIHWGDPDNLQRFLAHVTATAHRGAYVFSADAPQYLARFMDAMKVMVVQYGLLLLLSLWGWISLSSLRWKVFFAGVILFDLFYTVFLNIISLEITPFTLPSMLVLAILLGLGIDNLQAFIRRQKKVGSPFKKGVAVVLGTVPLIALIANYGLCNQRRNYTAYEHALNIFRTVEPGATIFLDGDNNVFPVTYGRIVEGMGEGITLYDRHNVIFRWRLDAYPFIFEGSREELESAVLAKIVASASERGFYFATINPFSISAPQGYHTLPYGILRRVVPESLNTAAPKGLWNDYCRESYHDDFHRDYMTREVTASYFFRRGENLFHAGNVREGLRFLHEASTVGYNDTSIHSDLGVFFSDQGLFENAREELTKALSFYDDLSGVHNNWGYYYHKKGNFEKALSSFRKALQLAPDKYAYYNNLGFTLNKMGKRKEAMIVFEKSLSIRENQPEIKRFMRGHASPANMK